MLPSLSFFGTSEEFYKSVLIYKKWNVVKQVCLALCSPFNEYMCCYTYIHMLIVSNNLCTQVYKIIEGILSVHECFSSRMVIHIDGAWHHLLWIVLTHIVFGSLNGVETLSTRSNYNLNFHILVHTINFIIILSGAILWIPLTDVCLLIIRIQFTNMLYVANKDIFVYIHRDHRKYRGYEAVKQERSFTPIVHI